MEEAKGEDSNRISKDEVLKWVEGGGGGGGAVFYEVESDRRARNSEGKGRRDTHPSFTV